MESVNNVKSKAMEFVDAHPRILLITVAVLMVIILVFYMHSRGYLTKAGFKGKKSGRRENMSPDEELDSLIESIHDKQKKKGGK